MTGAPLSHGSGTPEQNDWPKTVRVAPCGRVNEDGEWCTPFESCCRRTGQAVELEVVPVGAAPQPPCRDCGGNKRVPRDQGEYGSEPCERCGGSGIEPAPQPPEDAVERVARILCDVDETADARGWDWTVFSETAEKVVAALGVGTPPPETPTYICLDCGALGFAGGYHDHGDGNAGDTCSLDELLRIVARSGFVADERDRLFDAARQAKAELDSVRPQMNGVGRAWALLRNALEEVGDAA